MVDENIRAKIDFVVGGVDNLIRILEEVDYKIRDNILEYLRNHKPQLYEKVRASILLFEDFITFPDLAVQVILRELKTDQLARCLKNASPELTQKFFSNMSQGGAALLKEEMEFGRPVTIEQIEQERQAIMNKVKELEAQGKIQIREKKKISVFESEDATSPLVPNFSEDEAISGFKLETKSKAQLQATTDASNEEDGNMDLESYITYGEELYGQEKYEEAISYLQYVAESNPGELRALQLLGHCYYALNQAQEALQYYEQALALSPDDVELQNWPVSFEEEIKKKALIRNLTKGEVLSVAVVNE
jgi:tetratricopeptide (TPR) repeat protein